MSQEGIFSYTVSPTPERGRSYQQRIQYEPAPPIGYNKSTANCGIKIHSGHFQICTHVTCMWLFFF